MTSKRYAILDALSRTDMDAEGDEAAATFERVLESHGYVIVEAERVKDAQT